MGLFPFFGLAVISWLYRDELSARSMLIYWGLWLSGLTIVLLAKLHPGFFASFQCVLAIAMLIQLRVNPVVPR
jgi:hypothetical protein